MSASPDTSVRPPGHSGSGTVTATSAAVPPKPPQPVREWAFLLGGITLAAVLTIALLVTLFMARRRQRLRRLQQDWHVRRATERDAWSEAGRRAQAPTAEQLEHHAGTDAPPDQNSAEPQA